MGDDKQTLPKTQSYRRIETAEAGSWHSASFHITTDMGIEQVYDIIHRISKGFEDSCVRCLQNNSGVVINEITEQLWCGVDGADNYIEPNYDNDPYFEEPGRWYHKSQAYKKWKNRITPPSRGVMLDLPQRPDNVPNLYITGRFYGDISATKIDDGLMLGAPDNDGPAILRKYSDLPLLDMGTSAVAFFNQNYMLPSIEKFFKDCGYL